MKKIVLLLLMIGMSFTFGIIVHGAPETVDYTITFYDNYEWNIDDGSFDVNTNYMSSNRIRIQDDEITLNNLLFSHILFWDRNGIYLGYMNPTGGGYEGSEYLSDTGVSVVLPLYASWFSLTTYKLAPNEKPVTIFGGDSLEDVFTTDYKTTDIIALNNQSLNDIFITGNLVVNGDFQNGLTTWTYGGTGTATVESGRLKVFNTATQVVITSFNLDINDIIYLRYDYQVDRYVQGTLGIQLRSVVSDIQPFYGSNTLGLKIFSSKTTILYSIVALWVGNTNVANADVYYDNVKIIKLNALGISALTVGQMDVYYNAFTSTDILLEAFNDYNGTTFIQTDLNDYLAEYTSNLEWSDGLSMLLFYSMEATYDREEIIDDERSLPEKLNDFLDDIGLNSTLRFLVGLVIMVGLGFLLGVLHAPTVVILMLELLFFTLFVLLGWFQMWIVFIVAIALALGIIVKIKGGN